MVCQQKVSPVLQWTSFGQIQMDYYSIISISYNVSGILFVKPFGLIVVLVNNFLSSAIGRFCLLVVMIKSGGVWLVGFNLKECVEAPMRFILCLSAGYSCASLLSTIACGCDMIHIVSHPWIRYFSKQKVDSFFLWMDPGNLHHRCCCGLF